MVPTLGRIVIYKTTKEEREMMKTLSQNIQEELPAIIVSTWGDTPEAAFNVKVLMDGNASDLWKTSTSIGEGEGTCHWPPRV